MAKTKKLDIATQGVIEQAKLALESDDFITIRNSLRQLYKLKKQKQK